LTGVVVGNIFTFNAFAAAMDAGVEATVFAYFRELMAGRIAVLVYHGFSTTRMADQIAIAAANNRPTALICLAIVCAGQLLTCC
jgi:hypothetical protein